MTWLEKSTEIVLNDKVQKVFRRAVMQTKYIISNKKEGKRK